MDARGATLMNRTLEGGSRPAGAGKQIIHKSGELVNQRQKR